MTTAYILSLKIITSLSLRFPDFQRGLMLIMLRSIVGLSVMRQPLPQKLNRRNGTQIDLGAWMKRISK
jgi:hypothetical protein